MKIRSALKVQCEFLGMGTTSHYQEGKRILILRIPLTPTEKKHLGITNSAYVEVTIENEEQGKL